MIEVDMREVAKNLKNLEPKVRDRILKKAVRAAAKPIIKEARQLCPKRTGNLAKSIGVTTRRTIYNIVKITVSPRKGGKYDGYYGHMVEYGHSIVRKGKKVGYVPQHPFMRPAFESKGEESIRIFNEYLRKHFNEVE